MGKEEKPRCASCEVARCLFGLKEGLPLFCPMRSKQQEIAESREALQDPRVLEVSTEASRVEGAGYCEWTRVEEIIRFARRLDMKKIGIAFCVGLRKEARTLAEILEAHGFDVISVCCKVGGLPKEDLGLEDSEKVMPGSYEAFCNPIAQARILDTEGCDLNVLVGLCVGHDSLFIKHTKTLTTVLVAKDRVTGHNPAAVLYTSGSYYSRVRYPDE